MSTAAAQPTAIPQVEKQSFRNESPGWLSVRIMGADNRITSRPVAQGEVVWLTEDEQVLTANAPRLPEDNPFIPQKLTFGVDENGTPIERVVTPLTPVSENRYVPRGDRPIPAQNMEAAPIVESPTAPVATEQPQSADAPADHPHQPPTPGPTSGPVASSPVAVPPRAAAAAASEEETAAAQTPPPEHEETGAAVAPSQEATQGEYAAQEEVGTPQAPAAAPAPYVPPQEG